MVDWWIGGLVVGIKKQKQSNVYLEFFFLSKPSRELALLCIKSRVLFFHYKLAVDVSALPQVEAKPVCPEHVALPSTGQEFSGRRLVYGHLTTRYLITRQLITHLRSIMH